MTSRNATAALARRLLPAVIRWAIAVRNPIGYVTVPAFPWGKSTPRELAWRLAAWRAGEDGP